MHMETAASFHNLNQLKSDLVYLINITHHV